MFRIMTETEIEKVNGGLRLYPVYKEVWVRDHYEKILVGWSLTPQRPLPDLRGTV